MNKLDNLAYGDAGALILPWQDFCIPLYNGKTTKNTQAIVDMENSAVIKRRFGGGHCDYIADHASQGFSIIRECTYTTPAVVQTPASSRIYRWAATMLGTNTGKNLIACTGQALTSVKWADLCLYTCNDAGGKNITMVFFKQQETVPYELYKPTVTQKIK